MEIYLQVDNDTEYFNSVMSNIKESAFDDFDYPMPKKYKDLCSVYSDEYFRLFNRRKI